jgi:hypothetical protein
LLASDEPPTGETDRHHVGTDSHTHRTVLAGIPATRGENLMSNASPLKLCILHLSIRNAVRDIKNARQCVVNAVSDPQVAATLHAQLDGCIAKLRVAAEISGWGREAFDRALEDERVPDTL